MSESSELRDRAVKCRRLASAGVDALTITRLRALADDYDARALKIEDQLEDRTGVAIQRD